MWAQLQSETNSFKRKNRKITEIEDRVQYVDSKVYHRQVALFGYAKRVTERSTTSRAGRAISALRVFYRATVALHLILLARHLSGFKVLAFFAVRTYKNIQTRVFGIGSFLTLALFVYFFINSKDRRLLLLLALALMFPFTTFILSAEDDLPRQQGLIATSLELYGDMEPKVPVTNSSEAHDSNVSPNLLIAETNTISVLERCASLLIYLRSKATSLLARIPTLQEPQAAGKFELHPQELVDIRKVPDMPPESRREEYLYQTCDLIPPIGENLMTHLFHHPHEANERAITFMRSPKKRKQPLTICSQVGTSVGWGIQLVER
ncbi:MAG: hypothetical protein L6R40_008696 [Gallowayella cf. fulva]|nr:MAG: hypothetical protein L6R40_008696 [Xanthomendoza cf. fulva]